jgi:hypothetical protein
MINRIRKTIFNGKKTSNEVETNVANIAANNAATGTVTPDATIISENKSTTVAETVAETGPVTGATTRIDNDDNKNPKNSGKKITITFIQDALGKIFIQDYNLCSAGDAELKKLNDDRLILDEKKKTKPENIKKIKEFITYCPDYKSEADVAANKGGLGDENLQANLGTTPGGYNAFKIAPSRKTQKKTPKINHFTLKKFSKRSRKVNF